VISSVGKFSHQSGDAASTLPTMLAGDAMLEGIQAAEYGLMDRAGRCRD
jgi:hypothetical protein